MRFFQSNPRSQLAKKLSRIPERILKEMHYRESHLIALRISERAKNPPPPDFVNKSKVSNRNSRNGNFGELDDRCQF